MEKYLLVIALICLGIYAEEEEMDHLTRQKHNIDGEHNKEFDHEAIIGSKKEHHEFEEISRIESQRRLTVIIKRMDTNKDGSISKQELTDWVFNSFTTLDAEEAEDYFKEQDKNGDGKVTFSEYTVGYFGYKPDEVIDWKEDANTEMKEMAKMITEDEVKFKRADKNGDGSLDIKEYNAFYHPWDHDYMHDYEIDRTLNEQDENKDGFIDLEEYIGSDKKDSEDQLIETENFKDFDKDGDGKLDREEIKAWVIPDHMETATEESEHLMHETDENHDGLLSEDEIIAKDELWVGSAATDYGTQINEKFHDPAEL